MTTKIATCCYCGTRTVLRLTARGGHELACGNCGAPLHEMKALREDRGRRKQRRQPAPQDDHGRKKPYPGKKKKKHKRRKPMWSRALEEAFDFVEDIFD